MNLWLVSLSLATTLLCNPLPAEPLRVGTAPWRPFAYQNAQQQPVGIAVEVMQELARRTGREISLSLYPARRLNQLFDQGQLDINFADSPLWNPPRQHHAPLFTQSYLHVKEYLYFSADHVHPKQPLSEWRGLRIGSEMGYYYPILEPAFSQGRLQHKEFLHSADMLQLLLKHRIDAMAMDEWLFQHLLQQQGLNGKAFVLGPQLGNATLCLKLRPELTELEQQLDNALQAMKQDGSLQQIIDRYRQP